MLVKLIDHERGYCFSYHTLIFYFFYVNEHFSLNFLRKGNFFALSQEHVHKHRNKEYKISKINKIDNGMTLRVNNVQCAFMVVL